MFVYIYIYDFMLKTGQTEKFPIGGKSISCARIWVIAKICAKFFSFNKNCAEVAQNQHKSPEKCKFKFSTFISLCVIKPL